MKQLLKKILPPVVATALRSSPKYGWFGNYPSWRDAQDNCNGYNSELIFTKVTEAALKVRDGEAKFERDGVLFFREEYNWQLLSCLFFVAAQNGGSLHLVDFGGSLGSSYFQHQSLVDSLPDAKWAVVEQPQFVKFGRQHLQSDTLFFCKDMAESRQQMKPNLLVLSSVLQYLEDPFAMIRVFLEQDIPYIFIDRTAFTQTDNHQLTIQKVHPAIYAASYPAWFFNEQRFLTPFLTKYEIRA